MCIGRWFACTYLCAAPACSTQGGQKRALDFPGPGITEGCEVPHGCCALNPGLFSLGSFVFILFFRQIAQFLLLHHVKEPFPGTAFLAPALK